LRGELAPHQFDDGQAQFAEQQLNACDVNRNATLYARGAAIFRGSSTCSLRSVDSKLTTRADAKCRQKIATNHELDLVRLINKDAESV
jgi:hypothetical protein